MTSVIETARLTLRPHVLADFADCTAMWADPDVTRYIGGRPLTQEEVWTRLLRYAGHWSLLGFGFWAVIEKATGEYIGDIGFADFKRDIDPPLTVPEIGWALASRAHGKGYATEAIGAALAWGDAHFSSTQTTCLIHPENLASLRIAAKCGFREVRRSRYKDHTTIVFTRDQHSEHSDSHSEPR